MRQGRKAGTRVLSYKILAEALDKERSTFVHLEDAQRWSTLTESTGTRDRDQRMGREGSHPVLTDIGSGRERNGAVCCGSSPTIE